MNVVDLMIDIRKRFFRETDAYLIDLLKKLPRKRIKETLTKLNKWYYDTFEIKEFEESFLKEDMEN